MAMSQAMHAPDPTTTKVSAGAPCSPGPGVLVIEHDPVIQREVEDRLGQLGYRVVCVSTIAEAQQALEQADWECSILALEMPSQAGRPIRVDNGLEWLRVVSRTHAHIPVIVMTAEGHDSSDLAAEVIASGRPIDFIRKPFPGPSQRRHTLEDAARRALEMRQLQRAGGRAAPTIFTHGILRFHPQRVELLGVTICTGDGLKRRILDKLRTLLGPAGWEGLTGDVLADLVGAAGGTSISSSIKSIREGSLDRLLKQANVSLTMTDIICSGPYRFAPGITVEAVDADDDAAPPPVPVDTVACAMPDGFAWNARQVAIAARLASGLSVRRRELEAEFEVSDKTIKRDLNVMKARGLVVPQGAGTAHAWSAGPALRSRSTVRDPAHSATRS